MKKAASVISAIFHPLIMPTLGLLLILNSGTYLALLDPSAKRAILFVMALGTLIFPLIMLPVLYYRNLITSLRGNMEEGLIPQLIILILYVITFVYFVRIPVSRVIHGYALSVPVTLAMVLLANLKFRVCIQSAALGGITGLIIALIILYETPLQGVLMLTILAAGITGSAKLVTGSQHFSGILTGYLLGFVVVLSILLIY